MFRDTSGEIVVSYPAPTPGGGQVTFRFWLANRLDPKLSLLIDRSEEGTLTYRYGIENGKDSAAGIILWSLVAPSNPDMQVSHSVWHGFNPIQPVVAPRPFLKSSPNGVYVNWQGGKVAMIQPGSKLDGFEIKARVKPGITAAYFVANEIGIHPPAGEMPQDVSNQLLPLQAPPVNWKVGATIGPRFPSAVRISDILQTYDRDVEDLVSSGYLTNSPFVQELRRDLRDAVSTDGLPTVPQALPQTALEQQILLGLRFATGFR